MSNFIVWLCFGFVLKMLGGLGKLGSEYVTVFMMLGLFSIVIDFFRIEKGTSK